MSTATRKKTTTITTPTAAATTKKKATTRKKTSRTKKAAPEPPAKATSNESINASDESPKADAPPPTITSIDPVAPVSLPAPSIDDSSKKDVTLTGFDKHGRPELGVAPAIPARTIEPHPAIAEISPDLVQLTEYDPGHPYTEKLPCKLSESEINECARNLVSRTRQYKALLEENKRRRAYLRGLEQSMQEEIEGLHQAVNEGVQLRDIEVLIVADTKTAVAHTLRLDTRTYVKETERTLTDKELAQVRQTALPVC